MNKYRFKIEEIEIELQELKVGFENIEYKEIIDLLNRAEEMNLETYFDMDLDEYKINVVELLFDGFEAERVSLLEKLEELKSQPNTDDRISDDKIEFIIGELEQIQWELENPIDEIDFNSIIECLDTSLLFDNPDKPRKKSREENYGDRWKMLYQYFDCNFNTFVKPGTKKEWTIIQIAKETNLSVAKIKSCIKHMKNKELI